MKKGGRIAKFFDMPADAFGDGVRVTLIGRGEAVVCGRHRLIVCESERVVFSTVAGRLCVTGGGLFVCDVEPGQTTLCGRIDEISYKR